MVNNTHTICDYDKIIVNDGLTFLDGYLEVSKNGVLKHRVTDPQNKDNFYKVGETIANPYTQALEKILDERKIKLSKEQKKNIYHFCNDNCFKNWTEQNI